MKKLIAIGLAVLVTLAVRGANAEEAVAEPNAGPEFQEKNVAMAKTYAAKNDKLKAQELQKLKRGDGGKLAKVNARLKQLEREFAAAKVMRERAVLMCSVHNSLSVQKRGAADFNECNRVFPRIEKERVPLEREAAKLAPQVEKQKAEILSRHAKRHGEIQAAYDKIKQAIADGEEPDEAEILAAYEQVMNPLEGGAGND